MQYFKGDDLEVKMQACGEAISADLSLQKELFFEGAYDCHVLGDIIYADLRAPLANAIIQDIFRETFNEIFTAFTVAGTFESYMGVFRKVFGDDVDIQFTVPDPGKLNIDIIAQTPELSPFVARHIIDNQYNYDSVVDYDGDNIVFQTIKGFESQYELEQMLFELVPGGIYTQITLSF